jgi:hypothetical protein
MPTSVAPKFAVAGLACALERQSALQQDQVQREIEERWLFEEWRQERARGTLSGSSP